MNRTIFLKEADIYSGNLLLVNGTHPLRQAPKSPLLPVLARFPQVLLAQEASNGLRNALEALHASDEIVPVSGYRSTQEQVALFQNTLRDKGAAFTRRFVARPLHSEHETGLAIDLGLKGGDLDLIRPQFPDHGICGAFRAQAPLYGFVERYPAGEERTTGIAHEPWHFRYVGYPHSAYMHRQGLVLEAYIAHVRQHAYVEPRFGSLYSAVEVFFLPAAPCGPTPLTIPEQALCNVSGNNIDGFIVTLWRNYNGPKASVPLH